MFFLHQCLLQEGYCEAWYTHCFKLWVCLFHMLYACLCVYTVFLKEIEQLFGKYAYLLSCCELVSNSGKQVVTRGPNPALQKKIFGPVLTFKVYIKTFTSFFTNLLQITK